MQASAPSDQYLCAFILCFLLIFFLYFEQFLDFRFTRRPYCLFIIVCYRSAVGASIRQFLSREAVAVGIAKVVVQVIFTPISNISSNAIMVGSSLPVSFINPVYIRSSLFIVSTASSMNITVRQSRQSGVARFFRNYPFLCFPTYLSFASNKRFLQRPYIVRFIIFNRLFVPSTKPLL